MRTLYQAANGLEAQMLHDLLAQEGIATQIEGAYLMGGVGELPASGLVRLVVDEADYARGREAIERWEATEVVPNAATPSRPAGRFTLLLLGAALGVAASAVYFRAPLNVEGYDHNHDGVLDERWLYSPSGTFLGSRVDRNLDGKIDFRSDADAEGRIVSSESDDDFDGVFETRNRHNRSELEVSEVDTDGDTLPNLRTHYRHGVMTENEFLDPHTGLPLRVEHYGLGGTLTHADVDSGRDGRLDRRRFYSPLGEVTREEALDRSR